MKPSPSPNAKKDGVKNYGHLVLEIGLLYKSLLDMCKLPDRQRGIRLLKLSMVVFKQNSNMSKYSYEVMRLLVHQQSLLSEKSAYEEFYGLFVNTNGKIDGHIGTDERMEWLVNLIKMHIKHMFSNKTEQNIKNRSRALSGVKDIALNYDQTSHVIVRAKSHSVASSLVDEMTMVNDLRQIRPFQPVAGRGHLAFPEIHASMLENIDIDKLHNWVDKKNYQFATEFGN